MVKCDVILNHSRRQKGGRGALCHGTLLWACNKVLKPNFQYIIFQTNNGCSLLSLILAKLLILDIRCENISALCVITALTACPFSIKKCAKMNVFLCENRKNLLATGAQPVVVPPFSKGTTSGCAPLAKSWLRHCSQILSLQNLQNPGYASAQYNINLFMNSVSFLIDSQKHILQTP